MATLTRGDDPPLNLQELFDQFDEDRSGEISYSEFFNVLEHLAGSTPSMEAVFAVLQDIDMDGSGSIDFNEFVEFFSRLDDMDNLLTRTENRGKFCQLCSYVLFMMSLVIFFTILMIEVTMAEDDFGTDYAKVVRLTRNGSAVSLGYSFLQSVLLPIFRMQLGACQRHLALRERRQAKRRKDRATEKGTAQMAAQGGDAGPPRQTQGAWQAPAPATRASKAPPRVSYRPSKRLENSGASWSYDVPLPPDVPLHPQPPHLYPEPLPPSEPPPPVPRPRLPLGIEDDPGVGYEPSAYDAAAWQQDILAQAHALAPPCHFNPLIHSGSTVLGGSWPTTSDHNSMGSDVLAQR